MKGEVIYSIWLRDMKQYLRAKSRIITSLAMPLLWMVIIGQGLSSAIPQMGGGGFNYLIFMAPGIVGMTMLFTGTFSGVSVLWDKQFGFMKEILVAPVSRLHVMLGKVLGGSTTAIIQGVLILIIATFFGVPLPGLYGAGLVLLFMILISFSFVSIGLIFATRMEDPQSFPMAINFFIMPMFFLSGAIYPLTTAPGWLKTLAHFNPLAYGIDGLRVGILESYTSYFSLKVDLVVLLGFTIAVILIGIRFFERIEA